MKKYAALAFSVVAALVPVPGEASPKAMVMMMQHQRLKEEEERERIKEGAKRMQKMEQNKPAMIRVVASELYKPKPHSVSGPLVLRADKVKLTAAAC